MYIRGLDKLSLLLQSCPVHQTSGRMSIHSDSCFTSCQINTFFSFPQDNVSLTQNDSRTPTLATFWGALLYKRYPHTFQKAFHSYTACTGGAQKHHHPLKSRFSRTRMVRWDRISIIHHTCVRWAFFLVKELSASHVNLQWFKQIQAQ